jgi:hypothetical protein
LEVVSLHGRDACVQVDGGVESAAGAPKGGSCARRSGNAAREVST